MFLTHMFKLEKFEKFLLDNDCLIINKKPIKLKSGRISYYDVDIRNSMKDSGSLEKLCKHIYAYTKENNLKPDAYLGVPETGTPIAIILNTLIDYKKSSTVPQIVLRSHPKKYQAKETHYSVTPIPKNLKFVLIEDDVTTGNSLRECIKLLLKLNVKIQAVISVTNRLETTRDGRTVEKSIREDFKTPFYSITNSRRLIQKYTENHAIRSDILKKIDNYSKKYCK
jgi:orotate phosphoribosyltransferase